MGPTVDAIIVLVPSLFVCGSNFSRLWLMRTMGEDAYHALIISIAAKAHAPSAIVFIMMPAICIATVGLLLLHFYPDPLSHWGFYFASACSGMRWPSAFGGRWLF